MRAFTPSLGQYRVERLIALLRLVLAVSSFVAISLAPSVATGHATLTSVLLAIYIIYAMTLAAVVLRAPRVIARTALVTHLVDLAAFSAFIYLTEGPTSPFFVYFVFSQLTATLRWQARGALWTAAANLTVYIGLGIYAGAIRHAPDFELTRFIMRSTYLLILAALLTYVGHFEEHVRDDLRRLAGWPPPTASEPVDVARRAIAHATNVVRASRAVLVWDEEDEPWRYLAVYDRMDLTIRRESPHRFEPVVVPPLAGVPFRCANASSPTGEIRTETPDGPHPGKGCPLNDDLVHEFKIHGVLGFALTGDRITGNALFLDSADTTVDVLVLGEIACRELAASLDVYHLADQARRIAAADERIRLARDLHDGVLQSLTGARLQLQAAADAIEIDPGDARERVCAVERIVAAEQAELRAFVDHVRLGPMRTEAPRLATRLQTLVERMQRQWGLGVAIEGTVPPRMPAGLEHQLFLMIHEALVNAVRHGHATTATVLMEPAAGAVRVIVRDNGQGFQFRGRRTDADLGRGRDGPVSLRERAIALGGTLEVLSSEAGATVILGIPTRSERS